MLVATFGPSTAWVGRSITYSDGRIWFDGHPITSQMLIQYDRGGYLVWAYPEMRTWAYRVQARVSESVSDTYVWLAALLAPTIIVGWAMCFIDWDTLSHSGFAHNGMLAAGRIIPPVYVYERQRLLGRSMAPFYVGVVMTVALFVVLAIFS